MTYWRETLKWSESLAGALAKIVANGSIMEKLELL
jgi:hypothetical protein